MNMFSRKMSGDYMYDETDSTSEGEDSYTDMDLSDTSLSSSFLNPRKEISRSRWTKEEDDKLRHVIDIHGTMDWKLIASFFPQRSELQCFHRWQKVLNPDLIKGPWTNEEDEKVVELVQQYGPKRWSLISKYLVGRTGKQCRERWHNHLNPDIKKSAWTKEEDRVIYQAHKKLGNRWAEIAKLLPGRTDNAIKNHWNSTMKRKVETCNPYTPNKTCQTPSCTQTQIQQASSSTKMYTPDSDFMNANTIRDALRMRGPGQRVVRTLYPVGRESFSQDQGGVPKEKKAQQESPSKWLIMDNEGEISPFRDFPDLIDVGPVFDLDNRMVIETVSDKAAAGSTPIKFTHMSTKGSTGYRFDSQALSDLSRESSGSLIPITSPVTSKFSTPPTILRKARRKQRNKNGSFSDTSMDRSMTSSMGTPIRGNDTPQGTPIKSLPFSPSQFLNISTPCTSSALQMTSTPIGGNHSNATPTMLSTQPAVFRTPRIRRAIIDSTPRTPTPFKDALAAIEKAGGPIKKLPQTPNQLADISEIIARDEMEGKKAALDKANKRFLMEQAAASPNKRARKSLSSHMHDDKENEAGAETNTEETDASLLATSLLMSPPVGSQGQQEDLTSVFNIKSLNDAFNIPDSPAPSTINVKPLSRSLRPRAKPPVTNKQGYSFPSQADSGWWRITCGQTKDQQFMNNQARRMVLRDHKPRSLVL